MEVTGKIRLVRQAEGMAQTAFANEVGINIGTLRNYEQGRTKVNIDELAKITTHPRFKKYTLWLMTGDTAPEAGQISPEIEQERRDDSA